jgi:thioredoxin 1
MTAPVNSLTARSESFKIGTNVGLLTVVGPALQQFHCWPDQEADMASDKIVEITDHNFDEQVVQGKGLILVDFWAEWCGPCRMVAPILDELAVEYDGQLVVGKMNVDENRQTPTRFNIRSIPTILFFKNGVQVEQVIGAVPKSGLIAKVQPHL